MRSLEDYAKICPLMIKEMDLTRGRWFSLLKEVLTEAGFSVVNAELNNDIDIGISEEIIPKFYHFKYISGHMVEASLIGWQIAVGMQFVGQENYVSHDKVQDFSDEMVKVSGKDERWVAGIASFLTTEDFTNPDKIIRVADDIAEAIAYFVMGGRTNVGKLSAVVSKIKTGFPLLAELTQLGVATAFGDAKTAGEIMRRMRER